MCWFRFGCWFRKRQCVGIVLVFGVFLGAERAAVLDVLVVGVFIGVVCSLALAEQRLEGLQARPHENASSPAAPMQLCLCWP